MGCKKNNNKIIKITFINTKKQELLREMMTPHLGQRSKMNLKPSSSNTGIYYTYVGLCIKRYDTQLDEKLIGNKRIVTIRNI